MYDPRVPALRERLGVEGDADNKTYDKALADAVAKFQKSNKLPPTASSTRRRSKRSTARAATATPT